MQMPRSTTRAVVAERHAGTPAANSITLRVLGDTWHAEFCGPHAQEVRATLGTHVVPTAFTSRAPAWRVQTEIQRLNPGAVVRLAQD